MSCLSWLRAVSMKVWCGLRGVCAFCDGAFGVLSFLACVGMRGKACTMARMLPSAMCFAAVVGSMQMLGGLPGSSEAVLRFACC